MRTTPSVRPGASSAGGARTTRPVGTPSRQDALRSPPPAARRLPAGRPPGGVHRLATRSALSAPARRPGAQPSHPACSTRRREVCREAVECDGHDRTVRAWRRVAIARRRQHLAVPGRRVITGLQHGSAGRDLHRLPEIARQDCEKERSQFCDGRRERPRHGARSNSRNARRRATSVPGRGATRAASKRLTVASVKPARDANS